MKETQCTDLGEERKKERDTNYKKNQTEILELKNTITELETSQRDSTADMSRQKKESVNLNTSHLKLLSWKSKKKTTRRKMNRA